MDDIPAGSCSACPESAHPPIQMSTHAKDLRCCLTFPGPCRRPRKRVEDDDPDYEVGEEEREHVRARPARSRHGGGSRSGGYGGHNELSELRDQWVRARAKCRAVILTDRG